MATRATIQKLPPELHALVREERRRAKEAAKQFVRACSDGDPNRLYDAAGLLDENVEAWRLAMSGVAKLPRVSDEIQAAFVLIWVEHKMLSLTVGDNPVLARALRLLLPGGYSGPPLTVYRGTTNDERRRRLYGFSWTTDAAVARRFAEHRAKAEPGAYVEGLVLQTIAEADAILLVRQPEDYYDEAEVVVDPYRLSKIKVIERLRAV
jgi:hypothetical protein